MKTEEGYLKIKELSGRRIKKVDLINKGSAGQEVMTAIGLKNDSRPLDFEDGDLKTNKYLKGEPSETLFISQIKKMIGEFEHRLEFKNSWIYKKIKQFVYLPIHKDDDEIHIIGIPKLISEITQPELYEKLEEDFNFISKEISECIANKGQLSTINGPNYYLQIRTKASKNKKGEYTPFIYNNHQLKDKNMAFYFTIRFLKVLKNLP